MCSVTGLPQGKCPPVVEYMWSFGEYCRVCSVTGLPQGKCPPVVEYMWSFDE